MSAAPVSTRLQLRDFGAALTLERERDGYSVAALAKSMGRASKDDIRDWEAGHSAPSKVDLDQLTSRFPRLTRFEHDVRFGNYDVVPRPPKPLSPTPEPPPLPELGYPFPEGACRTFAFALYCERTDAGLSQEDIGKLCGVTGVAVSWWESESTVPVLENYEKLLDLFPKLKLAPKPNSRDLEVPVGSAGYERTTVRIVHHDPPFPIPDVPSPPPITTVQTVPVLQPEPEPMPEPVSVTLPAIVRWTKATAQLQLDQQQAKALSELLQAGAELGLGVSDVGKVLQEWPQRGAVGMGHR